MQQGRDLLFENMKKASSPIVELSIHASAIARFTALLQSGVDIETADTWSIGEFLDRLPGFTPDYIATRVQTVFLNGTAIDDLETPLAGERPVLALSAAMPGLAGAVFRKNSSFATFRSTRSHPAPRGIGTVTVTLKFFNMIATEKGEALLAAGVGCTAAGLIGFFSDHPSSLTAITRAFINGQELPNGDLVNHLQERETIHLIIRKDNG